MPVRAVENAQNAFSTAPTGINNVLPMSSDNFVTHVSGGPPFSLVPCPLSLVPCPFSLSLDLTLETFPVYPKLPNLIVQDAVRCAQQSRCPSPVAARALQRILQQVLLVRGDGVREREADDGARGFGGLQRGRQGLRVDALTIPDQHRAPDRVLELAHVAGPVIRGQHVNRRCRDAPDVFSVLGGEPLQEIVGQQQPAGLPLPRGRNEKQK